MLTLRNLATLMFAGIVTVACSATAGDEEQGMSDENALDEADPGDDGEPTEGPPGGVHKPVLFPKKYVVRDLTNRAATKGALAKNYDDCKPDEHTKEACGTKGIRTTLDFDANKDKRLENLANQVKTQCSKDGIDPTGGSSQAAILASSVMAKYVCSKFQQLINGKGAGKNPKRPKLMASNSEPRSTASKCWNPRNKNRISDYRYSYDKYLGPNADFAKTPDHIWDLSLGGKDDAINLAMISEGCNTALGAFVSAVIAKTSTRVDNGKSVDAVAEQCLGTTIYFQPSAGLEAWCAGAQAPL